jgi:hypothetical protein
LAVETFQLTLGSGTQTRISGAAVTPTFTHQPCREIEFQNNASHTMRVGDENTSATVGRVLAASNAGPQSILKLGSTSAATQMSLEDFYVNGTANDVLDITVVS